MKIKVKMLDTSNIKTKEIILNFSHHGDKLVENTRIAPLEWNCSDVTHLSGKKTEKRTLTNGTRMLMILAKNFLFTIIVS